MGRDPVAALVPHRAHLELIFLDTKGRLGLGALNVSLPELFILPVADVGTQEIGALGKRGPIVELPRRPCKWSATFWSWSMSR